MKTRKDKFIERFLLYKQEYYETLTRCNNQNLKPTSPMLGEVKDVIDAGQAVLSSYIDIHLCELEDERNKPNI